MSIIVSDFDRIKAGLLSAWINSCLAFLLLFIQFGFKTRGENTIILFFLHISLLTRFMLSHQYLPTIYFHPFLQSMRAEAEFLDVIRAKVLRVFLLAIHSHLHERIPPSPRGKVVWNWFVTLYTETSSLRTLTMMPRNLNEIVCSWIRLQVKNHRLKRGRMLVYEKFCCCFNNLRQYFVRIQSTQDAFPGAQI
jgi:hypothetical protein